MKKCVTRIILAVLVYLCFILPAAGAAFAETAPIIGKWKTIDDETNEAKSIVKIYEKDGKFYLDVTGHEKPDNKDLIPKSRLDQEISKRKDVEKGLQAICDHMIEDIPEDKRGIIPDLAPSH